MEIIWDKCAYIDIENVTHHIFHAGVKYIDRNMSQPNTIVIPGTAVKDLLASSDYVFQWSNGDWGEHSLLPYEHKWTKKDTLQSGQDTNANKK